MTDKSSAAVRAHDGARDKPTITLAQEWTDRNAPLRTAAKLATERHDVIRRLAMASDIAVTTLEQRGMAQAPAEALVLAFLTHLVGDAQSVDTLLRSLYIWLTEEGSH